MRILAVAAITTGMLAAACTSSVFDVVVGACVNVPDGETITEVETVDCAEPHDAEVFALPQFPAQEGAAFPGPAELEEFANERCIADFESYVGTPYAEAEPLQIQPLVPSQESWERADDRAIVCLLTDETGAQLTGSQAASG